jgi:hypothetical protein
VTKKLSQRNWSVELGDTQIERAELAAATARCARWRRASGRATNHPLRSACPRTPGVAGACAAQAAILWIVGCLGCAPADAGLLLEDALARDRAIAEGEHWTDLVPAPLGEGITAAVGGPGGDAPQLISATIQGRGGMRLVADMIDSAALRVSAGVAWRDQAQTPWSLEGSSIAFGLCEQPGYGEFYASVEHRHWGPGWTGSLILDGAAPPVPALGWRRREAKASESVWLAWMGPWSADVFVGTLQGHVEPARPYLIGLRLQMQPGEGLQIGLSRTLQWGGSGRDQSLTSLVRALLGQDNVGYNGVTTSNEPGNQLGGFDWRWVLGEQRQFSIYGQVVGEDEAGHLPSANLLLIGVDGRPQTPFGALRVFVEWTDLIAGDFSGGARPGTTYRSHLYQQGYTQDGVVLGHPAGGDVRLGSVGAIFQRDSTGAMLVAAIGRAEPTAQRLAPGRVTGLNAAVHADVDEGLRVGAGLWWWKDGAGRRAEAQLWGQYHWR